jgi:hypothetical protein
MGGIAWLVMTPVSVPKAGPKSQHPVWPGLAVPGATSSRRLISARTSARERVEGERRACQPLTLRRAVSLSRQLGRGMARGPRSLWCTKISLIPEISEERN